MYKWRLRRHKTIFYTLSIMEDITDEIYDLQLSMSNGSKVPCTITNRNEINCSSSVYTDHTGKH